MVLRPDEEANLSEIEREKRFKSNVGSAVKTGASLAATAATAAYGGPLAARVMPFLSEYIPVGTAIKGISKVSPKMGDFLKRGMAMGLPIKEGFDYLQDQLSTKTQPAKENRNIIEQYDPELHKYISEKLTGGESLVEAGSKALKHGRFARIIKDLIRDHKTSWSSILQTVFGAGQESPMQSAEEQQMESPPLIQPQQQVASGQSSSAARQRLNAARQMGKQALGNP